MPEKTLRVVARLKARADKASELRTVLEALIAPTRKEAGCISYELLENQDDPTDLTFLEEWVDGEALDSHFETDHIRGAMEKLPDLLAEGLDVRRYSLIR
jgi:quinol monooxygenase YgiN